MGVDTNIHVGPYLEIICNKSIETVEKFNSCSNKECNKHEKHSNGKFCPSCGSKIGLIDKIEFEKIDGSYIDGELYENGFEDTLCYTDPIFISNQKSPFDVNEDDFENGVDLQNIDMNESILWFKNTFREEIQFIENICGSDGYVIKYGILQWYS